MKNVFLLLLTLVFGITACNNVNKEELKQELLSDIKTSKGKLFVVPDSARYFYNELIVARGDDNHYIHHSTLDCPEIKKGVTRGWYITNKEHNNRFCHVCMTDTLITQWQKEYMPYIDSVKNSRGY